MTGFELQTSSVRSDYSSNSAKTTAHNRLLLLDLDIGRGYGPPLSVTPTYCTLHADDTLKIEAFMWST